MIWSLEAGCSPGIKPIPCSSLIYHILQHIYKLILFESLYNEHFTCKNAFVSSDQDMALRSVSPHHSLSLPCLFAGEEE